MASESSGWDENAFTTACVERPARSEERGPRPSTSTSTDHPCTPFFPAIETIRPIVHLLPSRCHAQALASEFCAGEPRYRTERARARRQAFWTWPPPERVAASAYSSADCGGLVWPGCDGFGRSTSCVIARDSRIISRTPICHFRPNCNLDYVFWRLSFWATPCENSIAVTWTVRVGVSSSPRRS